MVKDHFEGMRNLLKFAGMKSLSYKLGLIFGEYCIFLLMAIFLSLASATQGSYVFGNHWLDYSLALIAFGLPYVTLCNLLSYPLSYALRGDPAKASEKGF